MFSSLQAHYLDIEWQECGRARTITVAPEPIDIMELDDGMLTAETQVFHDLCPWVGLRLAGELAGIEPAFEGADGSLTSMLRLEDGQGGHWWVQNNGWDPVGKRHLSELHRSMGQFALVLGPYRLLLNNIIDGLTRVEVEEYLHDFQQDLIWLVMGFGGATAAANSGLRLNPALIEAFEAFTTAARQVLARPACAVREVQVESRLARLRPNAATFRQYLRTPAAQRLPGRGAEETPDIADNRYLRHLVQVCHKLAASLAKSVERHASRFTDRARVEAERALTYKGMTHRVVEPDIFDRQLAELEQKLACVINYCDAVPDSGETPRVLEFRAGGPFAESKDTIFINNKDGSKAAGESRGKRYEFSTLQLPQPLADAIRSTQSFCDYYVLEGKARAGWEQTLKGKWYRAVHFTGIYSAQPFTRAVERKLVRRAQLENNAWLAPLSAKERQENQHEARTADLRGQTYQQYGRQAAQASSALSRCQSELQAQDQHWQRLGVASSTALPMGVRFSQSPTYTACKVAFSRLMELAQRDGVEIDTLAAIERIGVLHASALYERWCLVKILAILMEDYHFQPEAGWQDQLVRAIAGKPESLELKLHREDIRMSACLEIQPVLPNGRRPDFRLRFSYADTASTPDAENDRSWWEAILNESQATNATPGGLVMDAKFRTRWHKGDLGRMLTSLIEEKGYGEQDDRVFILHPAPHAILKPTSPLSWGRDCDYGQEVGKEHRRGVVYLAPGVGEANPERNLRRLIVLQLQRTFPVPAKAKANDDTFWESKSFCIRCGKAHQPHNVRQQVTQRGHTYWVLACDECQMQSTRTHCYSCGETSIFKNGLNLTYHRTVADQVTNVVCPQCGKYFDNDVHGKEKAPTLHHGDVDEHWPASA